MLCRWIRTSLRILLIIREILVIIRLRSPCFIELLEHTNRQTRQPEFSIKFIFHYCFIHCPVWHNIYFLKLGYLPNNYLFHEISHRTWNTTFHSHLVPSVHNLYSTPCIPVFSIKIIGFANSKHTHSRRILRIKLWRVELSKVLKNAVVFYRAIMRTIANVWIIFSTKLTTSTLTRCQADDYWLGN